MTNKEKFKEVFGRDANINECPIYCDAPDEGKCPYYKNECYSGKWWDAEYKETTAENDLAVDCISRAQTQTKIEMNAFRYMLAKERVGMGQVEWSDQLIKVSDAVDIIRNLPSVTPQPYKAESEDT